MTTGGQSNVRARAILVLAAIAAAVGIWTIVVGLLDISITVPVKPGALERQPLRFMPVVFAALIAASGAWGLVAFLERLGPKGLRIWTWISVAVFVLTLPYMPGFTLGERVFLVVLHGSMFAILVPGMRRTSAVRQAARGRETGVALASGP
jgi:hypothetical protein